MRAARRADELLSGCNEQRRREFMPVRAAVAGKAGVHQAQTSQQLRARAEGAADARHAGALVQGQGGGDMQHLVHAGLRRLRHSSAGVGRKRLEIPARTLGVQDTQRQRGFSRAGHAGDADDLAQWDLDIDIFEIMDFCAPDEHGIDHVC